MTLLFSAGLAACSAASGGDVVRPRLSIAGASAADYFPLASGWTWTYEVSQAGTKARTRYAVLERSGDGAVVQEGDERVAYVLTPEGIAEKVGDRLGDYVIKNPVRDGAEWPVEGGHARILAMKGVCTSPLVGRYEGCVLVAVMRADPKRVTQTSFAPYLGRVQIAIDAHDGEQFVPIARAQLVAFTRPGDETAPARPVPAPGPAAPN